ncbi:uncharacterized protein LTR77_007992 [Saxophila tyrrhenica]|uniref:Uncharacterized protein n=1 Tax=Saxophila tyrrhenica TaxID=1690608 RepID=A0AAV9P5I1_9PEZI|nr:hypothetical protein LTR77_007992 [Saxophila tyrrhenica]
MSDKDDFTAWLDAQRAEMRKFHSDLEKDLRSWSDASSPTNTSPSSSSRSEPGPFERFKSFVDSNLASLSSGLRNFPSNVSELKAQMEAERLSQEARERDISFRWTGSTDSPDYIATERDRATEQEKVEVKEAAISLLAEAFRRNEGVGYEKIDWLYRDPEGEKEARLGLVDRFALGPLLSWGGACFYKPETEENLPSTALWGLRRERGYRWLSVEWFKRSPYSPINVEAEDKAGPTYRAAFEDLFLATLEKPMWSQEKRGERAPFGTPVSTREGPGLDWMLSLQCRGILPPQLPGLYQGQGFRLKEKKAQYESLGQCLKAFPLRGGKKDWAAENWAHLRDDWVALVDEVGVKAAPEPVPGFYRTPWRVPDTEEELYEEMLPPLEQGRGCPWEKQEESKPTLPEIPQAKREADHGLVDYQVQLDLIEQQNKRRLLMGREEAERRWEQQTQHEQVAKQEEEEEEEEDYEWDEEEEDEEEQVAAQHKVATRRDLPKQADVLSQLTTTHTTRLADGTVTTKMVLKQRFADGREEVKESVQTVRGGQEGSAERGQGGGGRAEEKREGQGKKDLEVGGGDV